MAARPDECDVAVVGAGIVGLACARELQRRRPGRRVVVLEAAGEIATRQTAHNSGVVHAGLYYRPDSLKAELCVAGARELLAFCAARDLPAATLGKVVVATRRDELPRLDELERRGRANGVPGLRRIGPDELAALEPHATGLAALHSPATGVADFAAVAGALAEDLRAAGGAVLCGAEVGGWEERPRALALAHARGTLVARHVVACAGAGADRLAVLAGARADPRIVPFRGAYHRLRAGRRHLVRGLIYPVPDPALPFLGVHLTRHLDGEVLLGPTALPAAARAEDRRLSRRDLAATLSWPGTWRLARRHPRAGAREALDALRPARLARAARRFVPDLRADDVEFAWAGVRAQALGRDGTLLDDFVFSATPRALHVRNAPSPAATSALAIARHVADRAEGAFGR